MLIEPLQVFLPEFGDGELAPLAISLTGTVSLLLVNFSIRVIGLPLVISLLLRMRAIIESNFGVHTWISNMVVVVLVTSHTVDCTLPCHKDAYRPIVQIAVSTRSFSWWLVIVLACWLQPLFLVPHQLCDIKPWYRAWPGYVPCHCVLLILGGPWTTRFVISSWPFKQWILYSPGLTFFCFRIIHSLSSHVCDQRAILPRCHKEWLRDITLVKNGWECRMIC